MMAMLIRRAKEGTRFSLIHVFFFLFSFYKTCLSEISQKEYLCNIQVMAVHKDARREEMKRTLSQNYLNTSLIYTAFSYRRICN